MPESVVFIVLRVSGGVSKEDIESIIDDSVLSSINARVEKITILKNPEGVIKVHPQ